MERLLGDGRTVLIPPDAWQYTRGSALLGWVKDDAEYIAREIARLAGTAHAEAPTIAPSHA
jgi:hypothetical protein